MTQVDRTNCTVLPLNPLTDKSLADRAYETIREAIQSMTLRPGEPLVEAKLATSLGISKTPIRQALHRLEQSGLVIGVPNKGYSVTQLTLRDAYEILELRAVLEGWAARRACSLLTDSDLDALSNLLERQCTAYETGQTERCADFGHQFHRVLHDRADNQRLTLMISTLNDQFHRLRLLSSRIPGRLPKSMEEHRRLFDALASRDAPRAEQVMRSHLIAVFGDISREELFSRDASNATYQLSIDREPSNTL